MNPKKKFRDSIMPRVTYEMINRMPFEELSLLAQSQWNEYNRLSNHAQVETGEELTKRNKKVKAIKKMNRFTFRCIREHLAYSEESIFERQPFEIQA